MSLALVCAVLIVAAIPEADLGIAGDPTRDYQEIRAQAGRSADEQVRLALWCEARGMARERLNHLTLAVLADPSHPRARGLLGMVTYEGRFQKPEAIAEKILADPRLAAYDARRAKAPYTVDGQWAMGLWAEKEGLIDQALAHFTVVIRLDPKRIDARKRLGQTLHEGRWLTDAQWTAEKAEAEVQKQADQKWRPLLEDIRRRLASAKGRAGVEAELALVDDPRSVPSILKVFGSVTNEQNRAVQVLGQIDSPASSRALAILALAGRTPQVRRASTETLRGRDPVEYAELLIGLLAEPIRYEVKPVAGLDAPGELLIEGTKANFRRVYTPPTPFQPGDRLTVNEAGERVVIRRLAPGSSANVTAERLLQGQTPLPLAGSNVLSNPKEIEAAIAMVFADRISGEGLPMGGVWTNGISATTQINILFGQNAEIPVDQLVAEAEKSRAATERKLRSDIRLLEDRNFAIRLANERVSSVLSASTGQSVAADHRAWSRWYDERTGYASARPEWTTQVALTEEVAVDYRPPILPDGSTREIIGYARHECFAAGTPVRTIAGPRPIESLQVGDRVLTQNQTTGALGYHPILATHKTASLATYRVGLRGDSIVASHFHRFWVAGRGWVMTRELKLGDTIRTLDGISSIESIEPDAPQTAYNLDVASDADYFVGTAAALVHDYTQPDPRLIPFDVKPVSLASKGSR